MKVKNNNLLTRKQVLANLSIGSSTLQRLIDKGIINPPFNISERTVRFLESDIQDFINEKVGDSNEK